MPIAITNMHLRTTDTLKLIPTWAGSFKVLACLGYTAYLWTFQTACISFTMCSTSLSSSHTEVMHAHTSIITPELVDGGPEWTAKQVLENTVVKRGLCFSTNMQSLHMLLLPTTSMKLMLY